MVGFSVVVAPTQMVVFPVICISGLLSTVIVPEVSDLHPVDELVKINLALPGD